MGIDYDTELIIGFELDPEKIEQWMIDHDIKYPDDINDLLKEKFPEIPEKIRKATGFRSSTWSIYIVCYGDNCFGEMAYFLTFYEGGSFTSKDIAITPELLTLGKKVYKELMDEELECVNPDNIRIFPTLHVW